MQNPYGRARDSYRRTPSDFYPRCAASSHMSANDISGGGYNALPGLRGLYVITDDTCVRAPDFLRRTEAALRGGARWMQYRNKYDEFNVCLVQAQALVALAHRYGAGVIVNDDPLLAKEAGADGVHLGHSDPGIRQARSLLGSSAIIGVSCYNELNLALAAQAENASYIAFGSFYPSRTKPDAVRASPALLRTAKCELHVPIAAIGGITPENGAAMIAAGADLLAVIEGVFGQEDIGAAAQRYARLFT